jgi:hypothetical protein
MTRPGTLPTFDFAQGYPWTFVLPARMTVLPLGGGRIALVSPIPIDDDLAAEIARLGTVRFLIAPNLLHHRYLAAASARYPGASVLAPPGLQAKRPELRVDRMLDAPLPHDLAEAVTVLPIEGAPALEEYAFFHEDSRTLIVTDLVFNMVRPRGILPRVVLTLVGCRGRLAQSRALRLFVKDRPAASASVERLLSLPFETLIVAHGEIVRSEARAKLAGALAWLRPMRRELPEGTSSCNVGS